MEFTEIENSVLQWIASHEGNADLARQIGNAVPIDRKYTEVGLWLGLKIPSNIRRISDSEDGDVDPVIGPAIKVSSGIFAESAIYVTSGYIDALEIFNVPGEKLKQVRDFEIVSK